MRSTFLSHARLPFAAATFAAPPADCRGAPFWSWNGRLDRARLFRQLGYFKEMGLGGATVHVRTGLAEPAYLSEDFLRLVKECADEGERLGMLTWLYDEDRWPSGFAGGLVTANPEFRCKHLRLTWTRCALGESRDSGVHHSHPLPVRERTWLAAWAVRVDATGKIVAQRRVSESAAVADGEHGLWAYLETGATSTWFNDQTYVDTFNPEALRAFIDSTHERYAATVGDRFGTTIPAIFTDEPLFNRMPRYRSIADRRDLCIPWTTDLAATFRSIHGEDVFDALPGVFLDRANGDSARDRLRFFDHLSERFAQAVADQLGAWCGAHGLALTGHLMEEASLSRQTNWVGDAMRSYRGFQLPGIDLLCDDVELTTAKQAQSAARQYGRPGLLSELYGVTNWDFDFQGHKRQGDWQAALGIIVRVHHLAWYSMEGEAKRDYPAAIGWQSPWFRQYRVVEDHFARVNTVLTRGQPHCRVAIVHGIESFWTARGPETEHQRENAAQESAFSDSLAWLLHGLIDADFLCESTLPAQSQVTNSATLSVGAMRYDAVVLPRLRTIRATTLARLAAFRAAGGVVIIAGAAPTLIDGRPDARLAPFIASCEQIELSQAAVLAALESLRELRVVDTNDALVQRLLHQWRREGDERWLFVCNTDRHEGPGRVRLEVRGLWTATALDTATGTIAPAESATTATAGWTTLTVDIPAGGHALLHFKPAVVAATVVQTTPKIAYSAGEPLADPLPFSLSEPNVLLLDRAAWRLDDGAWQSETEVLRASNLLRQAAGLPQQHGNVAQPWAHPPAPSRHRAHLAFTVHASIAVCGAALALERIAQAQVHLDGTRIRAAATGHYIDEDIATMALPDMAAGTHRLEISWPIDQWNSPEACYLLGAFGVEVVGRFSRIIAMPSTLAFGDLTRQGLPFYGANVIYHATITGDGRAARLETPHVRAPLLTARLDGGDERPIAFAPYRLDLGLLAPGPHRLDLTAYGSRMNTLGQLHNTNLNYRWWGPGSWRTTGHAWSDAYQLRPNGILVAPTLLRQEQG